MNSETKKTSGGGGRPADRGKMRARITLPVALLVASLSVSGVSSAQATRITTETRVQVPAITRWLNTKIDVPVGSRLTVTAVGAVNSASTNHDQRTPDGQRGCVGTSVMAAPGLPCYGLVAKVGSGKPFFIGNTKTISQSAGGRLYLSINDDFFADNSGSWHSSVAIGGAPSPKLGTRLAKENYAYPYPEAPDCNADSALCIRDDWYFFQGQCTSWVAYRVNQLNKPSPQFQNRYKGTKFGDASNWAAAAKSVGIRVDGTAALGAVAWYSGHVAYVEALRGDGSIVISEMNYGSHNNFDFQTVTSSYRWPASFIHLADRK